MTAIAAIDRADLARVMAGPGLTFRAGPFTVRVRSSLAGMVDHLATLYADHDVQGSDAFVDFDFSLDRIGGPHGWLQPLVVLRFDTKRVFEPLPLEQAPAMMEWGLNWAIATHALHFLILHAAVIARDGRALVLPGPPGAGKSTLCAALIHRGWRLLSDELALVSLHDGLIHPIPRPVSLKGRAIDVIRGWAPQAVLGRRIADTRKGDLSLMRPPAGSHGEAERPARPHRVIFPQYLAGPPARLSPRPRAESAIELARNGLNYGMLGRAGFHALIDLVEQCDCYDFTYGELDDAARLFGSW